MRGPDSKTEALFTYVTPESFVPKDHPLRAIRKMADTALEGMDQLFDSIYATTGRSSIPPEKLLKAQLLMILYSIRSNRQLVEQIHYNFLFRWFLGMDLMEPSFDPTVFTKNRERLERDQVAQRFFLAANVLDLTGDARDEIVLWDQQRVWIYTQDRPFTGKRIYKPMRNPDYNESNYRTNVSLPGWAEAK